MKNIHERILYYNSGSEGPQHDPYHYDEFSVILNGKDITLHSGLAVWIKIDKKKFEFYGASYNIIPHLVFRNMTGIDPGDFMKYYEKTSIRPCCDKPKLKCSPGFPGETLIICNNCNDIVGSEFNESAII